MFVLSGLNPVVQRHSGIRCPPDQLQRTDGIPLQWLNNFFHKIPFHKSQWCEKQGLFLTARKVCKQKFGILHKKLQYHNIHMTLCYTKGAPVGRHFVFTILPTLNQDLGQFILMGSYFRQPLLCNLITSFQTYFQAHKNIGFHGKSAQKILI